jgi:DNA-binding Xre family transcriptional regulator
MFPSSKSGKAADREERSEYELARLPRDVTTSITWYMKDNRITKAELARRMRVTPGRVSQILSGDENLTLRTLAAVCVALDAHFQTELVPNQERQAASAPPAGWQRRPAAPVPAPYSYSGAPAPAYPGTPGAMPGLGRPGLGIRR